jgi:hypothetical protein
MGSIGYGLNFSKAMSNTDNGDRWSAGGQAFHGWTLEHAQRGSAAGFFRGKAGRIMCLQVSADEGGGLP